MNLYFSPGSDGRPWDQSRRQGAVCLDSALSTSSPETVCRGTGCHCWRRWPSVGGEHGETIAVWVMLHLILSYTRQDFYVKKTLALLAWITKYGRNWEECLITTIVQEVLCFSCCQKYTCDSYYKQEGMYRRSGVKWSSPLPSLPFSVLLWLGALLPSGWQLVHPRFRDSSRNGQSSQTWREGRSGWSSHGWERKVLL